MCKSQADGGKRCNGKTNKRGEHLPVLSDPQMLDQRTELLLSRYEAAMDDEALKDTIATSIAQQSANRQDKEALNAVLAMRDAARAEFIQRLKRLGKDSKLEFVFSFLLLIETELEARSELKQRA